MLDRQTEFLAKKIARLSRRPELESVSHNRSHSRHCETIVIGSDKKRPPKQSFQCRLRDRLSWIIGGSEKRGFPRQNELALHHSCRNPLLRNAKFMQLTRFTSRNDARAFTLAEVLITLGIIGVVAAITIPVLNNVIQEIEYKTAYKKAYSEITRTYQYLSTNYIFDKAKTPVENFEIFKGQFDVIKSCLSEDLNNSECWDVTGEKSCDGACGGGGGQPVVNAPAFIDKSGMAWSLYAIAEYHILVDTNGFKKPNKYGKDRWFFVIDQDSLETGKISPIWDSLTTDNLACHYPPCYATSWLLGK